MKLKSISLNLLYKLTSEPVKSDEASKIHKLICRGVHADFEWTISKSTNAFVVFLSR